MRVHLNTRKHVSELTEVDLVIYPLWEYALDEEGVPGQDEATVRPVESLEIPKNTYCQHVATDFIMADGTQCIGVSEVTTATRPVSISPNVLFFNGKDFCLWASKVAVVGEDNVYDTEFGEELIQQIKKQKEEIFPISFVLRIPVSQEKKLREGKIQKKENGEIS